MKAKERQEKAAKKAAENAGKERAKKEKARRERASKEKTSKLRAATQEKKQNENRLRELQKQLRLMPVDDGIPHCRKCDQCMKFLWMADSVARDALGETRFKLAEQMTDEQ